MPEQTVQQLAAASLGRYRREAGELYITERPLDIERALVHGHDPIHLDRGPIIPRVCNEGKSLSQRLADPEELLTELVVLHRRHEPERRRKKVERCSASFCVKRCKCASRERANIIEERRTSRTVDTALADHDRKAQVAALVGFELNSIDDRFIAVDVSGDQEAALREARCVCRLRHRRAPRTGVH
jgi:hypothetical protein